MLQIIIVYADHNQIHAHCSLTNKLYNFHEKRKNINEY